MLHRLHLAVATLLLAAAPVAAQEPRTPADTTGAAPADTTEAAPADTARAAPADAAVPGPAPTVSAPETTATHDWEFALAPTDHAPSATGAVLVTEGDPDNRFVVAVSGLPPVDSLDQPGRDVAAYTVWIVPSKERVQEASLAGTIQVDATGTGRFEATTALDTFGVIVLGSPEGATGLSGVAVLTGIPITRAEPAPEPAPETPQPEAPAPQG